MTSHDLYQRALTADNRFTHELERVYGRKRAAEMRYRPSQFNDRELTAAYLRKVRADRELRNEMLKADRSKPPPQLTRRQANPLSRRPR